MAFEKMPMDEVYEQLDKTKWCKYQHSKMMSAFWSSKNPQEDYRKLMKETGFEENFITSQNECIIIPNLETARGKFVLLCSVKVNIMYP